jgi:hypothetical protein
VYVPFWTCALEALACIASNWIWGFFGVRWEDLGWTFEIDDFFFFENVNFFPI